MSSTIHSLFHPSHVTLTDHRKQTSLLDSIVDYLDDPGHQYHSNSEVTGNRSISASRSRHQQHHDTVSPVFDVLEDATAFYLQGEFPGILDKGDIMIEEIGPRSLAISAKVPRFCVREVWGGRARPENAGRQEDGVEQTSSKPALIRTEGATRSRDGRLSRKQSHTISPTTSNERRPRELNHDVGNGEEETEEPRPWILERHHGWLQRSFTFPASVDFHRLKARLGNGLLSIMVPKSSHSDHEVRRHAIED